MADLADAEGAIPLSGRWHHCAQGRGHGEHRARDESQTEKAISLVVGRHQFQGSGIDGRDDGLDDDERDQQSDAPPVRGVPVRSEPRGRHRREDPHKDYQGSVTEEHQYELDARRERRGEGEEGEHERYAVLVTAADQLNSGFPLLMPFVVRRGHMLEDQLGILISSDISKVHDGGQSQDDQRELEKLRQGIPERRALTLDRNTEGRDEEPGERESRGQPIRVQPEIIEHTTFFSGQLHIVGGTAAGDPPGQELLEASQCPVDQHFDEPGPRLVEQIVHRAASARHLAGCARSFGADTAVPLFRTDRAGGTRRRWPSRRPRRTRRASRIPVHRRSRRTLPACA
ncbi:Uncharacterised protein [Mycobacterium tuberculosis]|nr:Uncharacterised protein [Mycobacterium tuberculosis]